MKNIQIIIKDNTFIFKTFFLPPILIFLLIFSIRAEESKRNGFKVVEMKGHAFGIYKSQTWNIEHDERLPKSVEVMTEENGNLVLNDGNGNYFTLSGGGHFKVTSNFFELKKGHLWIQSHKSDNARFIIKTANSVIDSNGSELIISYDHLNGKTQTLVLRGEARLQNIFYKDKFHYISDGQFSFILNDVNKGSPRVPTSIGQDSFEKIMNIFKVKMKHTKISKKVRDKSFEQNEQVVPLMKELRKLDVNDIEKLLSEDLKNLGFIKNEKVKSRPRKKKNSQMNLIKVTVFGKNLNHIDPVRQKAAGRNKIDKIDRINESATSKSSSVSKETQQLIHELESFNKDFRSEMK